jgi:hypothetical protein
MKFKKTSFFWLKRDSPTIRWNDVFLSLVHFDFYLEATLAKEAGETTLKQTT